MIIVLLNIYIIEQLCIGNCEENDFNQISLSYSWNTFPPLLLIFEHLLVFFELYGTLCIIFVILEHFGTYVNVFSFSLKDSKFKYKCFSYYNCKNFNFKLLKNNFFPIFILFQSLLIKWDRKPHFILHLNLRQFWFWVNF